ncbi:MAG: nuclear transport factor 2 family protein [Chromatocurvus sp.]
MAHQLREFADRQFIHDLLVDYCLYLDRMELQSLAALFTADCAVVYGEDPRLQSRGAAALAASLERMWRWTRTSHHLSNVRIAFEGEDVADVTSYVMAWHERPDGSSATIYGQYRDRIVRTIEGWRIAERRMFMNGSDAGFTVPITPVERRPAPAGWKAPDINR